MTRPAEQALEVPRRDAYTDREHCEVAARPFARGDEAFSTNRESRRATWAGSAQGLHRLGATPATAAWCARRACRSSDQIAWNGSVLSGVLGAVLQCPKTARQAGRRAHNALVILDSRICYRRSKRVMPDLTPFFCSGLVDAHLLPPGLHRQSRPSVRTAASFERGGRGGRRLSAVPALRPELAPGKRAWMRPRVSPRPPRA